MRAYTSGNPTSTLLQATQLIFFFIIRKDAMAFFLPLRLGGQLIPSLAPVKGDRRSSSERTRSVSGAPLYRHSERGITKLLICERSELEVIF